MLSTTKREFKTKKNNKKKRQHVCLCLVTPSSLEKPHRHYHIIVESKTEKVIHFLLLYQFQFDQHDQPSVCTSSHLENHNQFQVGGKLPSQLADLPQLLRLTWQLRHVKGPSDNRFQQSLVPQPMKQQKMAQALKVG